MFELPVIISWDYYPVAKNADINCRAMKSFLINSAVFSARQQPITEQVQAEEEHLKVLFRAASSRTPPESTVAFLCDFSTCYEYLDLLT